MSSKGWLLVSGVLAAAVVALGITAKKRPETSAEGSPSVREAAVANLFYPGDRVQLTAMVDGFLAKVEVPRIENLRGLVSPHAGLRYSGQTAAYGYKQLVGRNVRTVIVMAPSHYAVFRGASIPDVDCYQTPLGKVMLSPQARKLGETPPFVVNPLCRVRRPPWWPQSPKKAPSPANDTPHTWEHSLEVQIPFLQRTLREFRLVPIVFGEVDEAKVADTLLSALDESTLLVASSDLSHFFSDEVARRMDAECTKSICSLDIASMQEQEACGKGPILALMHIARRKGWEAKLLHYSNSGDVVNDKSSVVGYASIAFFEPKEKKVTNNTETGSSASP
jgi:predicted class III extradiol MEMO1 family dioxygenase